VNHYFWPLGLKLLTFQAIKWFLPNKVSDAACPMPFVQFFGYLVEETLPCAGIEHSLRLSICVEVGYDLRSSNPEVWASIQS
jgi:hypothetical protein